VLTRALTILVALLCSACAWYRPGPPEYDSVRLASGLVVRDLVVPVEGVEVADGDEPVWLLWRGMPPATRSRSITVTEPARCCPATQQGCAIPKG
jgi:hypothetical protein